MEVFWKTIAQYNEGTWIAQIVITGCRHLADHTSLSETDTTSQAADEGIYGVFK